jgi:NADPH:quinone reductase
MKAALCKSIDGSEGVVIEDIAEPAASGNEAIVKVEAVGLNFADTLMMQGKYQHKPPLPFSPGAEISGVIESAPAGTGFTSGQRVMAYVGWGGARDKVAVAVDLLVPVPDRVPADIAASLSVTYGTAMHGLTDRGQLKSGETLVVTGAAGGAGQAAVEIGKLMGARVIAVVSSPEKGEVARAAGADELVIYPGEELKARLRSLTGGNGADVVYECVGGDVTEILVRSLAWKGRLLVVGFASGEIPKIAANLLLVKGADMIGVFWGDAVRRDPVSHRQNMRQLLNWVAEGKLKPRIHATYPLADINDALGVLQRREATGKVVLSIQP